MKRLIGSLIVSLFLFAFMATAWPTAAYAEDIVIHAPLKLTKIQPDIADKLYLQLEIFNETQSYPMLFTRTEKIPIQNGQYIGTITFRLNYNPPGVAPSQGPAKYYRLTVIKDNSIVSGLTGMPGTGMKPLPGSN